MGSTMTAEQAKTFEDGYSAQNAEAAEELFNERFGCSCQAYEDIFTFNRWKAQGFHVKKGEKSIKLSKGQKGKKIDKETGEEKDTFFYVNYNVFCRCQVKEIKGFKPSKGKAPKKKTPAPKKKKAKRPSAAPVQASKATEQNFTSEIPAHILSVLQCAETDGNKLRIEARLDRKTYQETNKILESLGGKWSRKKQAHIFEHDCDDMIYQLIHGGVFVDKDKEKKAFQYWPTPDKLARYLVELADIQEGESVLEPSAGEGAIVKEIPHDICRPHCVEIHEERKQTFRKKGYTVVGSDFLDFNVDYDVIIANPPFRNMQDIDHINHMIDIAARRVVSVCSASVLTLPYKKAVAFRERIAELGGTIEKLPEGSFMDSGTKINTCVVVVDTAPQDQEDEGDEEETRDNPEMLKKIYNETCEGFYTVQAEAVGVYLEGVGYLQQGDIEKRVFHKDDSFYMESPEQFQERQENEEERRAYYEDKREGRIDRLRERADKHRDKSNAHYNASHDLVKHIPMGQPILVGHHSEKRHRRTLERSNNNMRKSIEHQDAAANLDYRAEAAESNAAIYNDDPDALKKLQEKYDEVEAEHKRIKETNAILRKHRKKGTEAQLEALIEYGYKEGTAKLLIEEGGSSWYELPYKKREMKRLKDRIKKLKRRAIEGAKEPIKFDDGTEIIDNIDADRTQISFLCKPSEKVRGFLKSHSFRWSRFHGVWQKHRSQYAEDLAKEAIKMHIEEGGLLIGKSTDEE